METMHFHIAHTKTFFWTTSFRIQEVPMNNLSPMDVASAPKFGVIKHIQPLQRLFCNCVYHNIFRT